MDLKLSFIFSSPIYSCLIVVAIITSVVANFYNETKNKKEDDEIENTSNKKDKENDLNQ